MSMQQQEIQREIKRKSQKKDLLIEVRAKAFELQTALSDLLEFEKSPCGKAEALEWMEAADTIHSQAGEVIKGA